MTGWLCVSSAGGYHWSIALDSIESFGHHPAEQDRVTVRTRSGAWYDLRILPGELLEAEPAPYPWGVPIATVIESGER